MILKSVHEVLVSIGIPILLCSAIPWMQALFALLGHAPYFFGFCSSKTLNLFSVVQNICIRHAHARNSRLQILQLCISVIPDQDAQADEDLSLIHISLRSEKPSRMPIPDGTT